MRGLEESLLNVVGNICASEGSPEAEHFGDYTLPPVLRVRYHLPLLERLLLLLCREISVSELLV